MMDWLVYAICFLSVMISGISIGISIATIVLSRR